MKITVIGPVPPHKGGISEFNASLIAELRKEHDVQVLSWKKQYPPFLVKDRIDKDVEEFPDTNFILHYANPLSWKKAAIMAENFGTELILIPWVTPLATPVLLPLIKIFKKKTKAKVVVMCHNALPHEKTPLDKLFAKGFFKQADEVVVHSEEDKRKIEELSTVKVKKGFHPLYDTYKVEKHPENLKELEGKIILFFGFIRPYKGLHTLLDAMPKVLEKQKVTLLIVGEFWQDKQEYFDKIRILGLQNNVKIVGDYVPKEEVGAYFTKSDVVVLPYTSGTQSGIIQLAYNFDIPVICSDVGGFAEVVEDGKTGYVVPANDPEKLAESIIKFYNNQDKEIFQKNINQLKLNYSWENYCKILLEQ